jgi:3-methyladenine DNA glycosylase AlkD
MASPQTYISEVVGKLETHARESSKGKSPWDLSHYIGGGQSKLRYINLKIPAVRQVFRTGFTFNDQDLNQKWQIWNHIWTTSKTFEAMACAAYFAASRPLDEVLQKKRIILNWVHHVDNWAHSDELSGIYSRLLEHSPSVLWPEFKRWNTSKKPWLKRQSMVGIYFYARFRKKPRPVKEALMFIERHMDDPHYYVQKGVGWTLRECWNLDPIVTWKYLERTAHRIGPAGWTAATEKLPAKKKRILTELRACGRKTKLA